jgi:hypothetical protein
MQASFDSSYQALGLYYASIYLGVSPNERLCKEVRAMLERGLDWEASRIRPDGSADLTGNTRVTDQGGEYDPSGEQKAFGYQTAMFAFSYAGDLLGRGDYAEMAGRIARYKHWLR